MAITVVFRSGAGEGYRTWEERDWKILPVISIAPIRLPRLNEDQTAYSFFEEASHMRATMRTILRIAVHQRHRNLCIGPLGGGGCFRHPERQVAQMWREMLFGDKEFDGLFDNIVFALDDPDLTTVFQRQLAASNVIKHHFPPLLLRYDAN